MKNRILTAEEFNKRVDAGQTEDLRFQPVLLPAEADPELSMELSNSRACSRNVESADMGGIYPHQRALPTLLDNIQGSFKHGHILLIDYHPSGEGQHNWNMGINHLKTRRFGDDDCDFQVDFDQVEEEATRRGMQVSKHNQAALISQFLQLVPPSYGKREFERFAKAQGMDPRGMHPRELMARAMMSYEFIGTQLSQHYTMIGLTF